MYVDRILETCLYAEDLDAAEEFYSFLLGEAPYSAQRGRHVFFRCGNNMLLIFNPKETAKVIEDFPSHGAEGPGHVAFAIAAEKVPAWRDRLFQAEIKIEKEITWPSEGHSIYFRDPAGNSIELATPGVWNIED